jgi:threonine efflux protein
MSYVALLASLMAVDLLAAMSPGPNFLVVAQTAASASWRRGVLVVAGILAANVAWCLAVALGLSVLVQLAPSLYRALQVLGGLYLLYLGVLLWRAKPAGSARPELRPLTRWQAFARGLFANFTNPKSLAYFGSVFALFMGPDIPAGVKAIAVGIVLFDTVLWYGIVAVCFSRSSVQRIYASLERPLNRLAATMMILFAGRLLIVRN